MTRIEPLENLKDALGIDLQSLIVGHDVDADKRQLNREFIGSGNYKPTRKWMMTLPKYPRQEETRRVNLDPQPPISSLVLP